MWITIITVLFISTIVFALYLHYASNKQRLEKFEEMQTDSTMPQSDRNDLIIKAFEKVKQYRPSPNELHAFYDFFSTDVNYKSKDVETVLKDDKKYKKIMKKFLKKNNVKADLDKKTTADKQLEESNDINDSIDDEEAGKLVEKTYKTLFPSKKLSTGNKEFLMYKLKKLGNNTGKLEEYITTNDEYREFIIKRIDGEFEKNKPRDEKDDKVFKISRPTLTKSTVQLQPKVRTENTQTGVSCKDLEDEQVLAKLVSERNLAELKYSCLRSKEKYANVDANMVLLPDQKWSVPQKHPEVCRMSGEFNYSPSTEQTALIGTLLDNAKDTEVGSIMPEFEFDEK